MKAGVECPSRSVTFIDACAAELRIEQTFARGRGGLILKGPKTEAGRRSIHLPEKVTAELNRHLDAHVRDHPDALLFVGPRGAPLNGSNIHSEAWQPAMRKLCLKATIHDLRHSGATLAAQQGATTAELMRRIGHASPAMALRYQHASAERDRQLAERMDAII